MKRDFTCIKYYQLLKAIKDSGYEFFTFQDWCEGKAKGRYVILRHDVDLKASKSLKIAKIENDLNIRSSYFFRIVPQSNDPYIIKEIVKLGHEIGYHYEDLSLFDGNINQAIEHFKSQLDYFRSFYPVKTICMHGSPTSKYDNRKLWDENDYRKYGVIGEPYFDFLKPENNLHLYFTDTARMWDGEKYNVRDKSLSGNQTITSSIHSTDDFIKWFKGKPSSDIIMITTHPQRWTNNLLEWFMEFLLQNIKNVIKRLLYVKRS